MPRWTPFEPYFWSLVEKSEYCWTWKGGLDSHGYGRVWKDKRRQGAYRVAYELENGPIPPGMLACHHCDNKLCVRPSHIFIGTQKDNMQDWTKKGLNKSVKQGTLSKRGDEHWKRTPEGIEYNRQFGRKLKKEFENGTRIAIQDEKGRFVGTKRV